MIIWSKANTDKTPATFKGMSIRKMNPCRKVKKAKVHFGQVFNSKAFANMCVGHDRAWILGRLREYAEVKYFGAKGSYADRRVKLYGVSKADKCVACGDRAKVNHHVIMVINGGPNIKPNLVPLCHTCHAMIHNWIKIPAPEYIKEMDKGYRDTISGKKCSLEAVAGQIKGVGGDKEE